MLEKDDVQKLEEIAFVLSDRSKPTLICVSVGSYRKRDELRVELERLVPNCASGLLNISGQPITSLFRTIREQAPIEALTAEPGKYLLHIYGIEDSLLIAKDGKVAASSLLQELNMERENLFHEFPCCLILWTPPYFVDKLRTEAPDLWDWITYAYHFADPNCDTADSEIPKLLPMPVGVTVERKKRIIDLESRLQRLHLDDHAPDRAIRSAISLHKALGGEYVAAFRHDKAILSYRAALALLHQVSYSPYEKAELYFNLGAVYLSAREYQKALNSYTESLALQYDASTNVGRTWHQIGMVYQEQRRWSQALESYQKALEWNEKTSQQDQLGITWHQIGFVNEEQRNWPEALESYKKALEWMEKTGQEHQLGGTWHHIGRVYEAQRNWSQALDTYQKALEWNEKTGQQHLLGSTWHHVGRIYEEQRNWPQALESYKKALDWNDRTGQRHSVGTSWHHIGRVYEEQRNWSQALESYQKALEWNEKTGQQYRLGATWHQIGRIYQEQRNLPQALESYQRAIVSYEKTCQLHELGATWHQMGRVKEEQGALSEALEYYLTAYESVSEWDQEIIIHSLKRIFRRIDANGKVRIKDKMSAELYHDLEEHQD